MTFQDWLTTREISEIFADEITAAGGNVRESLEYGSCLYARSVLPAPREVRRGDRVQGGVALRATDEDIRVHPYVFRQVCTNGAIRAQAIQTRRIERGEFGGFSAVEIAFALREAVQACCSEEAFQQGVQEMRSSLELDADAALMLMPMIARLPAKAAAEILESIMRRHGGGRGRDRNPDQGRTRFSLMNAVTSVARDTRDPELRWRLEELGGSIPVLRVSRPPSPHRARPENSPVRTPDRERELVREEVQELVRLG